MTREAMEPPVEHRSAPRVLYVLDGYPSLPQTFVSNEVATLRAEGVHVDVLALEDGGAPEVDPDHALIPRRGVDLIGWWRLARRHPVRLMAVLREVVRLRGVHVRTLLAGVGSFTALADADVDRVHAHFAWGAAVVSRYAAIIVGAPRTVTVHARDIYVDADRDSSGMLDADVVVTVCEFNRGFLRRIEPRIDRIEIVPCGVEVPDQPATPTPRRIVSVGRLVPKKGIDVLIEATALLVDEFPDVDVRIVGDGPERDRLDALVARRGLEGNVTLLGSRAHAETLEVIATATAFVLPCRVLANGDSDALPLVIREAMVRAVPVISTRVAGIPETVDEGSGWVCDPERPDQIADAMRAVLRDPPAARRRGEHGRRRVEQQYTLAHNVAALRAVWQL